MCADPRIQSPSVSMHVYDLADVVHFKGHIALSCYLFKFRHEANNLPYSMEGGVTVQLELYTAQAVSQGSMSRGLSPSQSTGTYHKHATTRRHCLTCLMD